MDNKTAKKIQQLEEQLDLWEDVLHELKLELPIAGINDKVSIKTRIRKEILPEIKKINQDYSTLLKTSEELTLVEEESDEVIVAEIVDSIESIDKASLPVALQQQLDTILQAIQAQNKSATAKLKITIPIIPLLASYELDLDTESFLGEIWSKTRKLLNKKAESPNPKLPRQ